MWDGCATLIFMIFTCDLDTCYLCVGDLPVSFLYIHELILSLIFKPENKIIGFAGLKYLPEFEKTDIGFRFLPEYWGKGIATEVSVAIIRYGFEILKLENIIGIADPMNIGSCRVLEKVGLKFYKFDTYNEDDKKYNWYQISKKQYSSPNSTS